MSFAELLVRMPMSDLARLAAIPRVDMRALSTLFVAAACAAMSANVQVQKRQGDGQLRHVSQTIHQLVLLHGVPSQQGGHFLLPMRDKRRVVGAICAYPMDIDDPIVQTGRNQRIWFQCAKLCKHA